MSALEFAISNPDPGTWVLSKWVPRRWFKPGHWDRIGTYSNEAGAVAAMKARGNPHRPNTKYYDRHGGEDVGTGW
jgi:hypothetical protein